MLPYGNILNYSAYLAQRYLAAADPAAWLWAGWLWAGWPRTGTSPEGGVPGSSSSGRPARAGTVADPGLWPPDASPIPRATATTPSTAASGATSAMKSVDARLPRATRAAASPAISTATATSP